MKKITNNKTNRKQTLIKALGIITLAFLVLVSIAGASPFAYVANSNNVSVIDTATNTVVASVNVGNSPAEVAVSPDGKKVYVSNFDSNNVSVIDTTTNAVIASVNVGNCPFGVAFSQDGKKVYVSHIWGNNVSVIDTATNIVVASVNVGNSPEGVAVSPDGKKLYVANRDSNNVSVIDTATNAVITSVNLEGNCDQCDVAFSPDGKKLYVSSGDGRLVYIIDTATNVVTSNFSVGHTTGYLAVTPDGKKIYVSNAAGSGISVYDTTNDTSTDITGLYNFDVGGIALTPDGSKAYVTASDLYNSIYYVSVIDTATNNVTANINVGRSSWGIAIGPASAPAPILPIANFVANTTLGYAPLDVQFTDLSTNATHLEWNFGDDSANTSVSNPEHVYKSTGLFKVVLTASNTNGTDSKSMIINVTKPVLPVFPGCKNPPQDLDKDGLYEDINGNGKLESADIVVFFKNTQWVINNGLVQYFDFNHDGRINSADVIKLFKMIH